MKKTTIFLIFSVINSGVCQITQFGPGKQYLINISSKRNFFSIVNQIKLYSNQLYNNTETKENLCDNKDL